MHKVLTQATPIKKPTKTHQRSIHISPDQQTHRSVATFFLTRRLLPPHSFLNFRFPLEADKL